MIKRIENIESYRRFLKVDLGGNRARIIISCYEGLIWEQATYYLLLYLSGFY